MKRRELLPVLISPWALGWSSASAEAAPRWKFLGDDESLRATVRVSDQVVLICVFQTSLERMKPPFAEVVLHATVVQTIKGTHRLGDRVRIRFRTDSLPKDEAERAKFIEGATAKNLGSLKLAFLRGAKSDAYGCEWLDVPDFEPDMLAFVTGSDR